MGFIIECNTLVAGTVGFSFFFFTREDVCKTSQLASAGKAVFRVQRDNCVSSFEPPKDIQEQSLS